MAQLKPAVLAPDLERDDDLSIGTHLGWRMRAMIQSGGLGPGERLPSIRRLAAGTGVNVNTARTVYERLEQDGMAISRHGLGTFVAPHAAVTPTLEQFAAEVTESALAQGIDTRELARALYSGSKPDTLGAGLYESALFDDPQRLTEADSRSARMTLRGQIARLEAELAAYPELAAGTAPRRRPGPHVTDLDELEATRDELVGRLTRARADAQRRGERQGAARAQLEEMLADPAAHRWESISREQTGEPGCGHYQVRPAWGPVGALMNWWRVKVSSGCPLAVPLWAR
jgi:DNA-binding transcriptional regulator YhcF (GntR family)